MRAAALIALVFASASCAVHSDSQTVHRCIGEHGEISFSGLPCAGVSAGMIPPAQAGSTSPRTTGGASAGTHDTCPASADALRDVIAEAFARRDANTLAGVMRWDGVGRAAVPSRMRELAELTQRPLVGIDVGGAVIEASVADAPPPAPDTLMIVHTGSLDGGASEHEFRVTTAGGCFWLDW
jgi:hypothetical protein